MTVESLITQHIDTWTSAVKTKSTTGRGSSKKLELYGVKKLRELILELAVRGKLVPQDPNDEPASVLLERIAKEKAQLVKEKKIKKPKKLLEISEEEKGFALPVGWEWSHLQDLTTYIQRGKGPKYAESGSVKVVSQKCVQNSGFDLAPARYVTDESLDAYQEERFLRDNDILWNSTGTGTVGRANVINDIPYQKIVADSHVTVIRLTNVYSRFLWCFIMAPGVQLRISPDNENALVSGSTKQVELNTSSVISLVVPVAPLAEQHRIVAKVDELMALCDQLEQQTEASIEAHQLLVSTLLNTLANSADVDELMENWARISDHFDTLFTTEESIDQLKQTILQLAVMGKLVPQDPNDEPASVLLERIAEEKAQLIKEKKIKKQKALPPIADDEKPFDLPTGWEWCRTIDAGDIKLGRQRSPKDHSGPYMTPYLRVANVHDNRIDTTDVKEMNFTPEEQKTFSLEYGDILLNEGQSKELVGRPAMYRNEIPGACFQNTLLRFKVWSGVNAEFSLLYFRHCLYSGRFQKAVKQTTNMAHLSAARLIPIEFPLPPEKEQIRIVAKVEQLTGICNQLNIRLRDFQTTQLHLTDAIVEQVV
ncbi:restriction endonuclease subunit S [Photobacterium leiognathi]|uniref:restriction endonuclease subunit S n=1 Tax=Photobacterium leiognathi TaxID=553611 RepID=UPI0029812FBB|nr:restriction endonuclease subunit S [Photobacterium leiognathi]